MHMYFSSLRLWICLVVLFAVPAMAAQKAATKTPPAKAAPAVAAPVSTPAAVAAPSHAPVAQEEPPIECATCHKESFDNMAQSRHGASGDARTPWGKADSNLKRNAMCTACHGNAKEHMDDPIDKKPEVMYNKTIAAEAKNKVCISCHANVSSRIHWEGSAHETNEIACSDCHKVHIRKDPVLVMETQPAVCFNCHKDVRSSMMRISTHPLRTGQMACSSCHQPHGSISEGQLIKNTVNETCYVCHADKRGPYLWPHPPVQENCDNCHQPHGSNNPPMLQARMPYLCHQCHSTHSSVFGGTSLAGGSNNAQRVVGNSCANCHNKVHGSNHPSGTNFSR